MELSLQDDDADDAMTTHAPKAHKSTRQEADDDEDGVSFFSLFLWFYYET